MRRSSRFFLYLFLQAVLLGCMFTHAVYKRKVDRVYYVEKTNLVRKLGITDLCLFTEASYTRHPSLADFHTAFQDAPMALEHFPSGSLVTPSPASRNFHANMD